VLGGGLVAHSALQSTDCDYEFGALQYLDQACKKPLVIVRPRLKIFLEYPLGGAHGLNSQLLIGHEIARITAMRYQFR
jgi:hypothetical protein